MSSSPTLAPLPPSPAVPHPTNVDSLFFYSDMSVPCSHSHPRLPVHSSPSLSSVLFAPLLTLPLTLPLVALSLVFLSSSRLSSSLSQFIIAQQRHG